MPADYAAQFPNAKGFARITLARKRAQALRDIRDAHNAGNPDSPVDCTITVCQRTTDSRFLVVAHGFNPAQQSCWFWHVAINNGACVSN